MLVIGSWLCVMNKQETRYVQNKCRCYITRLWFIVVSLDNRCAQRVVRRESDTVDGKLVLLEMHKYVVLRHESMPKIGTVPSLQM